VITTILVAKTFVIDESDLILTIRRSITDPRKPLTWDIPGGIVEEGEDPTVGAIRETSEEAGIEIKNPQVFKIRSFLSEVYILHFFYYAHTKDKTVKLSFYAYLTIAETRFYMVIDHSA
jgi:8-oxo-dGTP pyrophosphatase MutT (NUDIX family)